MFKLPDKFPTLRDDVYDITDSYEYNCLLNKDGSTPFHKVFRAASIADDELKAEGIEDEDDDFNGDKLNDVCIEINRREQACNGSYPFQLEERGRKLRLIQPKDSWVAIVYAYLLLATRLNMTKDRVHAKVDGTLLFEEFSAQVAKNYWGARAGSKVFGTATTDKSFPDKITDLCISIGEGRAYKTKNTSYPTEKDAKLDVAVWKSFTDGNTAKLLGFGQCKTGTHWEDTISQLNSEAFCKSWFEDSPVVNPVRMFFITDSFPVKQWYSKASIAGIIFDRFRIMDFLPAEIDDDIEGKIRKWVGAAIASLKS